MMAAVCRLAAASEENTRWRRRLRGVLIGKPTQAGPYLIGVKVPSGAKLMPRHQCDLLLHEASRSADSVP